MTPSNPSHAQSGGQLGPRLGPRLGWSVAALAVAALSLGPSFTHVLEAWPRLYVWSPDLWREATVFNAQFMLFAYIGGPLDLAAIALAAILAIKVRRDRASSALALTAAILFALSLIVWGGWVAPVNAELAGWRAGPIPANFDTMRARWESGHVVIAALKLLGFLALSLSVARRAYPAPHA